MLQCIANEAAFDLLLSQYLAVPDLRAKWYKQINK